MTRMLPMGRCPCCRKLRTLRIDGSVRAHEGSAGRCEGTGRAPLPEEDVAAQIRASKARAYRTLPNGTHKRA